MLLFVILANLADVVFGSSIDFVDQCILHQKSVVVANVMGQVRSTDLSSFYGDIGLSERKDVSDWRFNDEERRPGRFDLGRGMDYFEGGGFIGGVVDGEVSLELVLRVISEFELSFWVKF